MAGRFRRLRLALTPAAALAAAFLFLAGTLAAAPAPTCSPAPPNPHPSPALPIPSPSGSPQPSPTVKVKGSKPDEWDQARRLFEQLSPDQKEKFRQNLEQWKNMPPAQQNLFRDLELVRRERIAQEIQDAINKSGLHLNEDQREVYALRYTQERRKIEDRLRKEMDQKRQAMLADMLTGLKREFGPSPTPAATPPAGHSGTTD